MGCHAFGEPHLPGLILRLAFACLLKANAHICHCIIVNIRIIQTLDIDDAAKISTKTHNAAYRNSCPKR